MRTQPGLRLLFPTLLLGLALAGCNDRGEQARRQSQSNNTQGTSGQAASQPSSSNDNRITTQVQSKFFTDRTLKGAPIQVQTSDGVVTLRGSVANNNVKQEAAKVAQGVNGVGRVDDQLQVASAQPPSPAATSGQGEPASATSNQQQPPQDDAAITTEIEAKFFTMPVVSSRDIGVNTNNGNVTLSGDVQNDNEHQQALSAAKSVPGVKGVNDQLSINPQLAPAPNAQLPVVAPGPEPSSAVGTSGTASQTSGDDQNVKAHVESMFFENGNLKSSNITVSTKQGVVTLSGTVSDPSLKQQAVQIAQSTPGVKNVVDQIQVQR